MMISVSYITPMHQKIHQLGCCVLTTPITGKLKQNDQGKTNTFTF